MSEALTSRQREALKVIYTLIQRNGAGPTIREMRSALDVTSDQTIIDMLARLEKRDFIIRDKKQARGTSLTEKAKIALGILSADSTAGALDRPVELDEQEQKVTEKLTEIDPRLAVMYKGALFALKNKSNEDRIAQSAHSAREVIDHLSHKGNPSTAATREEANKQNRTGRTVRGLNSYFDPQSGLATEKNPYKHLYDEYQTKLQDIAHHSKSPTENEYLDFLKALERFLLRYVFPSQVEVYKILDEILKAGPDGVDPSDLLLLTKKNVESNRFFFKHADARWLAYLKSNSFLEPTWETGDYLAKVAPEKPDLVLEVFLESEIPEDGWAARTSFAVAASKLPPEYASQTIDKIIREEWVKDTRATVLHYKLQDLMKTLLEGKEYGKAIALAERLLDVFPKEYGTLGMRHTISNISEYEYDQVLKSLAELSPEDLHPFVEMLANKLKKILSTVHARGEEGGNDYSYIWRPAVEEHSQNHSYDRIDDCVISGVRDLLERRIGSLTSKDALDKAREELESVLANDPEYPLLTRIKLHIYRLFPQTFKKDIEREISHPRATSEAWHEYSLLVAAHFSSMAPKVKKAYLDFIDSLDKKEDKYADSWRARLIGITRGSLTASQKKKYQKILKNAAHLDQPHFTSYQMETSWIGPNSPQKETDFENKTVDEVIELLKSWQPKGDDFFGPTRSGLGMVLRNVVTKEGKKYSDGAEKFSAEEVRSVYIYNLFSGLVEATKTHIVINWKAVLELASNIISKAQAGTLPVPTEERKRDGMEADWDNVMQEISRLVIRGLETNGISFSQKEKAWSIIKYLCEHPDPTKEHEEKYGGDNSDPYTMSINTVRGDAFHAVFAYIFWYNREEKNTKKSWKAHVPNEAKKILELHLDPTQDSSLTVRSVYGRYFPWMMSYGGEWAKNLIPKVFPTENLQLRYAAWETYLSNMVFEDVYKIMRPLYELAVEELRKGKIPKRKYWADVTERLANHALVAYIFEIEGGDGSFYKHFFDNASGKACGMAVSIAGRHFISREGTVPGDKVPRIEVMQKFWEWRLSESQSPSELREFGWWTKRGKFNDKWLLERLLETVRKTKGDIDGEYLVMDTISDLSDQHPLLCGQIIKQIFTSPGHRDRHVFLHMGELRVALIKVLKSGVEEAIKVARDTIDHLLKLGYEDLRTLEDLGSSDPT